MTTLSPALEAIIQFVKYRFAEERCSTNRCQYRKVEFVMHGPRSCSDDDRECEKQQGECDDYYGNIEDEEGDDEVFN